MPLQDNSIEQLASGAELHYQMHEKVVLISPFDADNVGVLREVVHDLDLAPHILVVLPAEELALGDRFACVLGAGGLLDAEIGGAKLPLAKLLPDPVMFPKVGGLVREHGGGLGGGMGRLGGGGGLLHGSTRNARKAPSLTKS